jgi:integrase
MATATKRGKPKERANGEGSIWQNPNGTWTAQITPKDRSGKRLPKKSKTFQSNQKRLAVAWIRNQNTLVETGKYIESNKVTLDMWWTEWFETHYKHTVSEAQQASVCFSKARLPKSLLEMSLTSIGTNELQAVLNDMKYDHGYSRRTVEMTRAALHMCFDKACAVVPPMLLINPVKSTSLPKEESKCDKPIKALTYEEEDHLISLLTAPVKQTAKGLPNKADMSLQTIRDALYFILKTGCRREEGVQIKWEDWDSKTNTMHIRGSKNDYSDRYIPILDDFILKRYLDQSDIDHSVHDLRHTYITRAAQAGINPKVLQLLVGHSDIKTTLKHYTHIDVIDKVDAVKKVILQTNKRQEKTMDNKDNSPIANS